jgi:ATP-dependent Zn protease
MSIKKEAAYHEAGHVVVAAKSKYHNVVDGITLSAYGQGEASISLSKAKCLAECKTFVDAKSIGKDKDIAREAAIIFMAGYQAELLAAAANPMLTANRSTADPDYELAAEVLARAELYERTDCAEQAATEILLQNWELVEKIANAAYSQSSLSFDELHEILNA